ncbi:MAG TPA: hypothetical protein VHZ25_11005 [Acidobacteriaceae bacterium]|jgi:hypothetical protein|nr:hypothetical protein [Acidobacteriaceae bacterium]
MVDQKTGKHDGTTEGADQPIVVDAIRHVGPTLEAEGTFIPTGELPENRIENERLTDETPLSELQKDEYDREADAMGAEELHTRLAGDTSSDPHTDSVRDNPAAPDTDRNRKRRRVA